MKRIACIYTIVNLINGKRYVGSTIDFHRRQKKHVQDLEAGRHANRHLQNAWRIYGPKAFKACIVSVVGNSDNLLPAEQSWLDGFNPEYNICIARPNSRRGINGMKASVETRRKMSAAKKGRKFTKEHRANMSRSKIGCVIPPEIKAKISLSRKGYKMRPEIKDKIRASHINVSLSEKHRASIIEGWRRRHEKLNQQPIL